MKTAVDRVGRGKQRDVNARFKAMASHYVFETEFCNPAAGWEKGQVEKNVRDARSRMWQVMPVFKDLDELNQWLEDRCTALWAETQHRDRRHRKVCSLSNAKEEHLANLADFASLAPFSRVAEVQWSLI